jgi:hypothetical protein
MQDARLGELLSRLVKLTNHDVCEILEEQERTNQRFGQIALGWDICTPEHVWEAWSMQLADRTPRVDLKQMGIDTQATQHVPSRIAVELGVIPVRTFANGVVVAASERSLARAVETLPARIRRPAKFVLADAEHVSDAINTYYADAVVRARHAACASRPCSGRCAGSACTRHAVLPMVAEPLRNVG